MSEFPADFIPLTGADLFDARGLRPPNFTLNFQTPPEYLRYLESAGPTAMDEKTETYYVQPGQIRDALIARYKGPVTQALWQSRLNRNNSILPQFKQQTQLDRSGASMTYLSAFGNERVVVNVPVEAAREIIKYLEEEEELYMLVLYSGNKIAAIPMSRLDGKTLSLKPTIKKTLSKSDWGSDFGQTVQLQSPKGYSAFTSAFGFKSEKGQPLKIVKDTDGNPQQVYLHVMNATAIITQRIYAENTIAFSMATPREGEAADRICAMDGIYSVDLKAKKLTKEKKRYPPITILPKGDYVYVLGQQISGAEQVIVAGLAHGEKGD